MASDERSPSLSSKVEIQSGSDRWRSVTVRRVAENQYNSPAAPGVACG